MNATVVGGPVPVSLQFSIPLLILGNLTRGNQKSTTHSDGQATSRVDETTGLPPGYTAYPDVGAAYKIDTSWVTWHQARKLCALDGGYLAVVDTPEKLAIAHGMITRGHPWIGVHNLYNSSEWSSINTGFPISFLKWWPIYPLNIETWHCLFIITSEDEATHANQDCEDLRGYLCEIPITKQLKFEVVVKWIP